MSAHTPGPWTVGISTDRGARQGRVYVLAGQPFRTVTVAESETDARLIAAAPDLLTLAHQYASECGECAGTRVMPDDEPCEECAYVWRVIDQAEGRV